MSIVEKNAEEILAFGRSRGRFAEAMLDIIGEPEKRKLLEDIIRPIRDGKVDPNDVTMIAESFWKNFKPLLIELARQEIAGHLKLMPLYAYLLKCEDPDEWENYAYYITKASFQDSDVWRRTLELWKSPV